MTLDWRNSSFNILPSCGIASNMTEPKQRRGQAQRRTRILDETRALVARHGADGVTMRGIAEASGVAEKTLFNLYRSKRELIAIAIYDRSGGVFREAVEGRSERGVALLARIADSMASVTLAEPAIARSLAAQLVTQVDHVNLSALYEQYVSPILRDMVTDGELVPDAPIDQLTRLIRLNVIAAVLFWSSGEIPDGDLVGAIRIAMTTALLAHTPPDRIDPVRRAIMNDVEKLSRAT